ncbi:hypothetical protein HWV62_3510 [Athelia sp. TMB]|nr:hypothetical protein HWV62_3510 [Athelia sp. TMB]
MQAMGARIGPQPAVENSPTNVKPLPLIITENLNPEVSSSDEDVVDEALEDDDSSKDEEEGMLSSDEDDGFGRMPTGDDMDDEDEFDPQVAICYFAATRTPGINSDSASDIHSLQSAGGISTSNPSALSHGMRVRSRLSPVRENRGSSERYDSHTPDSYFEMLTPAPSAAPDPPRKSEPVRPGPRTSSLPSPRPNPSATPSNAIPEPLFARQKVAPAIKQKSALTAILSAASSRSSNPFSDLYAAISGRAESAAGALTTQVFFPLAREPRGEAMDLVVRKDATMEEVLGFALWSYWEEGWLPKLGEGLEEEDPKLSAVGWILRIAEDDGEVDEDFPSPDRTAKISKFNFGAYAVLEASPAQIQQNIQLESKIQRRPSRTAASAKKDLLAPGGGGLTVPSVSGPGTSALFGTTPVLSSSLGPSSGHGPQIFLRIRVADTTETVHISTTIPVSAGMYMQESLDIVCRKRKLDPRDFALVLNDNEQMIFIPLDRTVASLQGKRELLLVKSNMLQQMGIEVEKKSIRTTDPNASIFKRMSDVPEVQISAAMDFTAAYKKYTVYRKMPMLVARQERGLAIDGAYIHIMPSASKARAVFDNGKTTSFNIKSIVACQQSTKSSSIFKLVVQHDNRRNKRYDFEAESSKLAGKCIVSLALRPSYRIV